MSILQQDPDSKIWVADKRTASGINGHFSGPLLAKVDGPLIICPAINKRSVGGHFSAVRWWVCGGPPLGR